MWQDILNKFRRFPAQEKVIRLILQMGFQVNDQSRVVSGGIEIPHAQITKELGVDRRVVDTTASAIHEDETFKNVFKNVHSMTFLGDAASAVARYGINIRQAVSDDPYFVESPKLTLITDGKIHAW